VREQQAVQTLPRGIHLRLRGGPVPNRSLPPHECPQRGLQRLWEKVVARGHVHEGEVFRSAPVHVVRRGITCWSRVVQAGGGLRGSVLQVVAHREQPSGAIVVLHKARC